MKTLEACIFSSLKLIVECITAIATIVTAAIAGLAYYVAQKEYRHHVAREKANSLAQLNERYSKDENIKTIIDELLENEKGCNKKNKDSDETPSNGTNKSLSSINQREMFLRFFEELEYSIIADSLDEKQVYTMFAYYALYVHRICERQKLSKTSEEKLFIKDYEDHCWDVFRSFCSRMERIDKKSNHSLEEIEKEIDRCKEVWGV